MINVLIDHFRSKHTVVRVNAAETILSLFGRLKSLHDYEEAVKHLLIEQDDIDIYKAVFERPIYVQLLGIASLNSNGYVREKAIHEIARLKDANGLRFILLRLGDWVEAVREAATSALSSFLKDVYFFDVLQQLPTIDRLLAVERVDLRSTYHRIMQFILNRNIPKHFIKSYKPWMITPVIGFDRWKLKAINLFTTPPSGELERANLIYARLDVGKLGKTAAREKLLQELKFYLG